MPEHWSVKAIKWETPVLRGASPRPIDDPIYFDDDDGEYSWVRISDVTSAGTYLSSTEQKLSRLGSSLSVKLKPGALFLSIAGSVGKPCITQIKCCIHDGFVYFPRFKGDAKFLYYLFASGEPYRGLGKLGTQLNLNTDTVGSIVAGFPDVAEQRSIAAFLDRETGRVDRLVAKKRELIERLKEKRTALISHTVTRGLPPAAARAAGLPANPPLKPSALDWLGDIPAHWEVKKLSWLFRYAKGPSAAMLTKEYVADNAGDFPVFSGQTENEGLMGMIDWHEFNFASPVIFVTTVGARAMSTRIVSCKFSLSQNCALIIPRSKNANPRYYEAVLRRLFDYERRSISLIMQPSLRFDDLDKFRVPLPPPEEQAAIAAYLDEETAKLDALVGKVEAAVERLQEYRTALITAAVTGKIDVRKESHG
ncbi:MAG TPA: restriction endonuclease subunit S [Verrucomicrobiae bacterium]|nr:restriction endonuclease subunit S [Verrucomicrobiae bacterium]